MAHSKDIKKKDSFGPEKAKLEQQIKELEDKLARSLADYVNLEKRHGEQHQLFATLAIAAFITQMLEVLDDLQLAYQHLPDPGLKMAIDHFLSVLKNQGLEEVKAKDESFNPETMECLAPVDGDDNKVIEVKRPGYLLNGQCLRPAQVFVGKTVKN